MIDKTNEVVNKYGGNGGPGAPGGASGGGSGGDAGGGGGGGGGTPAGAMGLDPFSRPLGFEAEVDLPTNKTCVRFY